MSEQQDPARDAAEEIVISTERYGLSVRMSETIICRHFAGVIRDHEAMDAMRRINLDVTQIVPGIWEVFDLSDNSWDACDPADAILAAAKETKP